MTVDTLRQHFCLSELPVVCHLMPTDGDEEDYTMLPMIMILRSSLAIFLLSQLLH